MIVESAVPLTAQGFSLQRAHLVGVGGAGMSGIARILADRGFAVSGSDARDSPMLAGLAARGVLTAVGHRAENLTLLAGGPTAVVVSTAVRPDNPEVLAARAAGVPVVRRADALAALMNGYRGVCIAGTHGKTSTTSMLTVALQQAGLDPSFAIGGELTGSGLGAHHGTGDIFVAEADESDGSFLSFAPHGAVITNLEPDHLDHHGTAEAYTAVFDQFVDRIEPGGFLVVCADDPGTAALAERSSLRRVVSYGRSAGAAGAPGTRDRDRPGGRRACRRPAAGPDPDRPGRSHAAQCGGRPCRRCRSSGSTRRIWRTGWPPTPGCGAASSSREPPARSPCTTTTPIIPPRWPPRSPPPAAFSRGSLTPGAAGRLVVVFQPHLYSRTATFADAFGRALGGADLVVVLDVYGAREQPMAGVSGELITAAVPAGASGRALPPGSGVGGSVRRRRAAARRHRDHHGRRRRHRHRPGTVGPVGDPDDDARRMVRIDDRSLDR